MPFKNGKRRKTAIPSDRHQKVSETTVFGEGGDTIFMQEARTLLCRFRLTLYRDLTIDPFLGSPGTTISHAHTKIRTKAEGEGSQEAGAIPI